MSARDRGSANTGVSGDGGTGEAGAEGYVGIARARNERAWEEGLEVRVGEERETGRRGEWKAGEGQDGAMCMVNVDLPKSEALSYSMIAISSLHE